MRLSFALCAVAATVACGGGAARLAQRPEAPSSSPPRPSDCREVGSGENLAGVLASATAGSSVCAAPGVWEGRVTVPVGVTLWGPPAAVIKSAGQGSTVTLMSGSKLLGTTVDGSGGRFDLVDAAVKIEGEDIEVAGVTVRNSAFGILSEKSRRVTVRGNLVFGTAEAALGMRGDGIRLWETRDSLVEDNYVEGSRDCVVWYSGGNTLRRNRVVRGRYGMHFMYSHDNHLEANHFADNEVGVFVMYSRGIVIVDNEMWGARGAAGMGMGVKESGNLTVRGNSIADNTLGVFLDDSPLTDGDRNLFEGNEVRLNDVGVAFLSSAHDNTFKGNAFVDNFTSVRVDGGGDAMALDWTGNAWSDYVGYDLDGDEIGDVPFELADLGDALVAKYPSLSFLRGTPALALVSIAGEVAPLLAPKPVLRDARPQFRVHLRKVEEGRRAD